MISEQRMAAAAEELFQALLDSLPNEDLCSATFTHRFQRKMKRLIHRAEHPARYRVMQKVASIALVIFIGFMTILAISPNARAAFFGWVQEQYDAFTKYYFEGTVPEDPTIYKYELSELPDGFEEFSRNEIPDETTIFYANYTTNQIMHFTYSQKADKADYFIKSGEFSSSTVYVNNTMACFYEAYNATQANILVWENSSSNTFFCISAFLDSDSIIQIAEKIIKIQQ